MSAPKELIYKPETFVEEPVPHLIGGKCNSCGTIIFPYLPRCYECLSDKTAKIDLSPRGKIHSYSIIRVPPDPSFAVPYVIAYIDLPEDVRVFGQLEIAPGDLDKLKMGIEVETTVGVLRKDEQGRNWVSYKFKPIF